MDTAYIYKSGAQLRVQCVSPDDNLIPRALSPGSQPSETHPRTTSVPDESIEQELAADEHGALTWSELSWRLRARHEVS
jgi:hypothetical protein